MILIKHIDRIKLLGLHASSAKWRGLQSNEIILQ